MSSSETPRRRPASSAPYRIRVAMRLLWVRRVNLISVLGVMVGIASIITVMAVMDGFQRELRTMIRGTLSDLIIADFYSGDASFEEVQRVAEGVDGVEAVTLQAHTGGVIPAAGSTRSVDGARQNQDFVRIVGIAPKEERRVSTILESFLPAPDHPADLFELDPDKVPDEIMMDDEGERRIILGETPRVVISEWLAKRLGRSRGLRRSLDIGDEFQILTLRRVRDKSGKVELRGESKDVVISRIYNSGNQEYDKLHVYLHRDRAGPFFFRRDPGGTGHPFLGEMRIRLRDYDEAGDVTPRLGAALAPYDPFVGNDPDEYIETWEERQRPILRAVENEKSLLGFVLFFIILVACFTIFATLTMTVVEKTREIGVLRALGATPRGIRAIFLINGTLVGIVGAVLGYGVGLLLAGNLNPIRDWLKKTFEIELFPANIYLFEKVPTYVDHGLALKFAVGAVVSAMLFALIPAVRAARLKPVKALRYE